MCVSTCICHPLNPYCLKCKLLAHSHWKMLSWKHATLNPLLSIYNWIEYEILNIMRKPSQYWKEGLSVGSPDSSRMRGAYLHDANSRILITYHPESCVFLFLWLLFLTAGSAATASFSLPLSSTPGCLHLDCVLQQCLVWIIVLVFQCILICFILSSNLYLVM